MKDVVIVSACRTAIGAFGGTLRDMNSAVIGSVTMKEAISRAGIDPSMIDDVRFGCCLEHADALNVARVSALMAGIPEYVTAVTINRVCISGMEAVISGMAMIQAGMADIITLVEGDAHEEVKKLKGSIDILFLDADKEGYIDYLNKLLPLVRPGGLVIAHNITPGMADPRYMEAITTNPNLETIVRSGVGVTLKK